MKPKRVLAGAVLLTLLATTWMAFRPMPRINGVPIPGLAPGMSYEREWKPGEAPDFSATERLWRAQGLGVGSGDSSDGWDNLYQLGPCLVEIGEHHGATTLAVHRPWWPLW